MIDVSAGFEWALLIAVIVVVCIVAFALTARRVGGWRRMQAQLSEPDLPTRYLVLIVPATVAATVLIDPLDSLGVSWVSGVLSFLALFAGSLWWARPTQRSTRARADTADDAAQQRRQRRLAWISISAAAVLAMVGVVVLAGGNGQGGWTSLGASAAILSLLGLGWWLSRRR